MSSEKTTFQFCVPTLWSTKKIYKDRATFFFHTRQIKVLPNLEFSVKTNTFKIRFHRYCAIAKERVTH